MARSGVRVSWPVAIIAYETLQCTVRVPSLICRPTAAQCHAGRRFGLTYSVKKHARGDPRVSVPMPFFDQFRRREGCIGVFDGRRRERCCRSQFRWNCTGVAVSVHVPVPVVDVP